MRDPPCTLQPSKHALMLKIGLSHSAQHPSSEQAACSMDYAILAHLVTRAYPASGLQGAWRSFLAPARAAAAAPPRSAPPSADTTAQPASRYAPLSRLISLINAGQFSKAWTSLDSALLADDLTLPEYQRSLADLHPQAPLPQARATGESPLAPFLTDEVVFHKAFKNIKHRCAPGLSRLTFEHLAFVYHFAGHASLFALITAINCGSLYPSCADLLRDARLIALQKPKRGVRPLAIGECLLRMFRSIGRSQIRHKAHQYFATNHHPDVS
eukprot:6174047-Pleurochrysis_carterae.AAC.2